MSHKASAIEFLQTCALGSPTEAFQKFVAPNFIHHNMYFKGDRASLLAAMEEAGKTQPNVRFEVKRALEDGDTVAVHSSVSKKEIDIAVVHILRFEKSKIVEMWDLGQIIDKNSPNENGLF